MSETFESALRLGSRTPGALGASAEEIAEIEAQVRKRDAQRLELELKIAGGLCARLELFTGRRSEQRAPSSSAPRADSRAGSAQRVRLLGS